MGRNICSGSYWQRHSHVQMCAMSHDYSTPSRPKERL